MKRKWIGKSILLAVLLSASVAVAMADITVTAPEDTADPLFTQPVPKAWTPAPQAAQKPHKAQEAQEATVTEAHES